MLRGDSEVWMLYAPNVEYYNDEKNPILVKPVLRSIMMCVDDFDFKAYCLSK